MTEKEFWVNFRSTTITKEQALRGEGKENNVSLKEIIEMGELLMLKNVSLKAKEIILMTLAHNPSRKAINILRAYNKNPDKELRYFAEFAQQECEMSNI